VICWQLIEVAMHNPILSGLKERRQQAAQRIERAQEAARRIDQELMAASNEFKLWTTAIEFELRRSENQQILELENPAQGYTVTREEWKSNTIQVNRTKLVYDSIRSHPGMTTDDLWSAVQQAFDSKEYLYSVTKRLRDRKLIELRDDGFHALQTQNGAGPQMEEESV
jgi:hypothetical protein